jgi:hypothetical protein
VLATKIAAPPGAGSERRASLCATVSIFFPCLLVQDVIEGHFCANKADLNGSIDVDFAAFVGSVLPLHKSKALEVALYRWQFAYD